MTNLSFRTGIEIGISRIDQQHHTIFMMVDELAGLLKKDINDPAAIEIIKSITKYTVEHFLSEEIYMAKHVYPEFEKHKSSHSALVKQIQGFTGKMVDGRFEHPEEIIDFLQKNVLDHIQEEDLALGEYLRSKGVS